MAEPGPDIPRYAHGQSQPEFHLALSRKEVRSRRHHEQGQAQVISENSKPQRHEKTLGLVITPE